MKRPPVVVVLGHVDHGKTTLLDYIRKTNIAAREAGAITQHIGAYQINLQAPAQKITFIDTPGHEAFSQMRSRGAGVADLAILVVAADDGVMPQTKEAIKIIKEAKIPLLVALNKTDLPGLNLEKIKKQLVQAGVLLEGYGGEVVCLPISAKTGKGVKELLEMIVLISEMGKLKGEAEGPLEAVVIESKMDKNRGPLASVLVKNGTLRQGEEVFAENIKGKVKAMTDDKGLRLTEATPGTPVEILGMEAVPPVGSIVNSELGEAETEAKRTKPSREKEEDLLKIILKADTLGTLEAIMASLEKEKIDFIETGTGDVSDSDVLLARTTGAIILGFNVKIHPTVAKLAESEKVKVKTYDIIYELLDEIKEVIEALGESPEEESLGKAEIIAEFPADKGKIAGCRVKEGRLAQGDKIKVLRKETELGISKIKSLRIKKESVSKVDLGQECGIIMDPQLDFNIGDIVISQR